MIVKTYAYYFEKLAFVFQLDTGKGADTPVWLVEDDIPPLPPRKAIEISKNTLSEMLCDYPYAEPTFHSIALVKVKGANYDWWYYDTTWYVWSDDSLADSSSIEVPVLMNGLSPPYEVTSYDDRMGLY